MRGVQGRWPRLSPLRRSRRITLALAAGSVVIIANQFAADAVVRNLHRPVHLFGPLGLRLVYNTGSAFNLFAGSPFIVAIAAAAALVVVGWMVLANEHTVVAVGGGCAIGGGIANLIDRFARAKGGAILDYVTLSHWPTFNVADASITIGLVAVGVGLIMQGFESRRVK